MTKKINFKIKGIHCQSCKTLIETDIKVLPGVQDVEVNYTNGTAVVEFEDDQINLSKIFEVIRKLNYQPCENNSLDKKPPIPSFLWGLIIPVVIFLLVVVYLLFTQSGGFAILAQLNEKNIGYGLIFIIGLLAGFHCIGMCGGLVITYSALSTKNDRPRLLRPHFLYNFGRLISYTLIGGVLGGLGKFFGVNPIFTGLVMLIAGTLMILMGLSFVTNWSFLEKIKIKTPDFIAKFLFGQKHNQNPKGPLIIGLLNGFMPCGPLQAMQLYALASGGVVKGALSMGIYALGTIPLMFGFGVLISKISQRFTSKILKISGLLVIILGLIMFSRGYSNLANINLQVNDDSNTGVVMKDGFQEVRMELNTFGYQPNTLYIKKDVPVHWIINAKQISGCTKAIRMDDYSIYKNLQPGENIIEFTPKGLGEIKFSCGMQMVWGKFIVTDNGLPDKESKNDIINNALAGAPTAAPTGGCGCGGGKTGSSCH